MAFGFQQFENLLDVTDTRLKTQSKRCGITFGHHLHIARYEITEAYLHEQYPMGIILSFGGMESQQSLKSPSSKGSREMQRGCWKISGSHRLKANEAMSKIVAHRRMHQRIITYQACPECCLQTNMWFPHHGYLNQKQCAILHPLQSFTLSNIYTLQF